MRVEFTLDCLDIERLAAFWAAAAGFAPGTALEGRYLSMSGHGVVLTLQRVAEPKAGKNRMHLDLLVHDVEAHVDRLQRLGASVLTPEPHRELGQTWYVLADPEGNEFCVGREPGGAAASAG